jgi:hypothetical protein
MLTTCPASHRFAYIKNTTRTAPKHLVHRQSVRNTAHHGLQLKALKNNTRTVARKCTIPTVGTSNSTNSWYGFPSMKDFTKDITSMSSCTNSRYPGLSVNRMHTTGALHDHDCSTNCRYALKRILFIKCFIDFNIQSRQNAPVPTVGNQ